MKRPAILTRRALAAVVAAAPLCAASAQDGRRTPPRPSRLRAAAARVRAQAVPRNISPAFRFIA